MSIKHTPGPWHASKFGSYVRKTPPGIEPIAWNICTMNVESENYENDARLIAAAPQLLQTLKALHAAAWKKGCSALLSEELKAAAAAISAADAGE